MPQLTIKKPYKFTYIWLQKSGFTTFEALEQIIDFFQLTFQDVSSQGLKDEDAITEQLISIKSILTGKDIVAFNKNHRSKNKFLSIKYIIGYGNEPVKERMLHGNSFRIVVRNLEPVLADSLIAYISNDRHHYFINYYDNQRFGMSGGPYNTHLVGKAIVENDWENAYEYIKITNNSLPKVGLNTTSEDFKRIIKSMNPKKISFFVSSYNSFLWNIQASQAVSKHTKSKCYLFENVGKLYLPIDHFFQCPQICQVEGYEEHIIKNSPVQSKIYKRNLVVSTTIYAHNLEDDELHKNMKKITLSFFLPTGSYATMIIKQFFLRLKNK